MKILACALLALAVAQSFGTSYYLSANGNDLHSGHSSATAWKTLAKVNGTKLAPGDQIFLHGGDTFAGTLYFTANRLSVTSYGSGQATIDAGAGDGIDVYDVAGASISNIAIEGGWVASKQTGNNGSGINAFCNLLKAKKLAGLTISNVTVHGFMECGIVVGAYTSDGSQSGFTNVAITGCRVYSNGQAGIESYGYFDSNAKTYAHVGFLVDSCTVYDNEGIVGYQDNTGNGIVLGQVQNATIQYCESYQNGALNGYPYAGPVGIWAWDSDNVTIQHCEAHHNQTQTCDGDGFDLDGGAINSVMQYNYSHDNAGAGFLIAEYAGAKPQSNLTVRYNVSQNDGTVNGGGLVLWNAGPAVHDCTLYNNTVFTTLTSPAVNISTAVVNVSFRNNVLVSSHGPLVSSFPGQSGVLFQGNDYWAEGAAFSIDWEGGLVTSLAAWRALGQEKLANSNLGLWIDPGYVDLGGGQTVGNPKLLSQLPAYHLKVGSPIAKAGVPMADFGINPGPYDFYGLVLHSGAPDIGASQAPVGIRTP